MCVYQPGEIDEDLGKEATGEERDLAPNLVLVKVREPANLVQGGAGVTWKKKGRGKKGKGASVCVCVCAFVWVGGWVGGWGGGGGP